MCRLLVVGMGLLWLTVASAPAPAQEGGGRSPAEAWLRHGERALRPDDFLAAVPEELPKGDPPDELPIQAYSHTMVRYRFEADTKKVRGRYVAQVKNITFQAVFDRARSWIARPEDQQLLDHHQGHFDLARITAYQAEITWQERLRTERSQFQAEGSTSQAAIEALDRKIATACRALEEEFKREQQYFDQRTRYGTLEEVEAEERARQRKRLRELAAAPTGSETGR